jgi:hypothetical protein
MDKVQKYPVILRIMAAYASVSEHSCSTEITMHNHLFSVYTAEIIFVVMLEAQMGNTRTFERLLAQVSVLSKETALKTASRCCQPPGL